MTENNQSVIIEQQSKRISSLEDTLTEVKFFLNLIHDSSLRGSTEDAILQAVHGKHLIDRALSG